MQRAPEKPRRRQNQVRLCTRTCFGLVIRDQKLASSWCHFCFRHSVETCFLHGLCTIWPGDLGFMLASPPLSLASAFDPPSRTTP